MDFDKYSLKLTMKAGLMYEQLTGKNFLDVADEMDAVYVMYCSFVTNNNVNITFEAFVNLMDDKKVANWIASEYTMMTQFTEQFQKKEEEEETNTQQGKKEEAKLTLTDAISTLIFENHLDPHYVMYEMDLWELTPLIIASSNQYKVDMEEKRLWAFINVIPHIDHKKCKSPEKMLPFPWDKEKRKKKAQEELERLSKKGASIIGMKLNV